MINEYDWRADIKNYDSLYDLDPVEVMIQLRHQYLSCAKDLIEDDPEWAYESCMVAELLQQAIETQVFNLTELEPSK